MDYREFFRRAYRSDEPGFGPYDYQRRLAEEPWPDVLNVPTGTGKTAAVTLAWLYKRGWRAGARDDPPDANTPRRLVWCLPMRVLVEQAERNVRDWLEHLGVLGEVGSGKVSVHLLMGGADDLKSWAEYPEEDMILVGTQDMLLSRALMRGYGMSRYQWPVHFAFLHNDALWVYDEVQLMGAALPTSTQLEGFRRGLDTDRQARSLWVSATLHEDWLQTVDFRCYASELSVAKLTEQDREDAEARLYASRELKQARARLDPQTGKRKAAAYIGALADEVTEAHQHGEQTLIILNRVERAQALYRALEKRFTNVDRLLLHARFRPAERRAIERRLHEAPGGSGRVIVATQAVEAGVDISSRTLFTELAPWSSLVQRFGRCNRAGEHFEAEVYWVDITDDADAARPYAPEALSEARACLNGLTRASPDALPDVEVPPERGQVLRRRDLLSLLNTDPDLSGFDVDVSPYIRDPGMPQAQVFWRDFDEHPTDAAAPARDELCPVGLGQLKDYLEKQHAWSWDPLGERWQIIDKDRLRPGLVLLLRARDGGYLSDQGFVPEAKQAVPVPEIEGGPAREQERYSGDPWTMIGRDVPLTEHLQDVAQAADELARALALPEADRELLVEAGRWHDVGKAHEAFQRGIGNEDGSNGQTLWAKSARSGRPDYFVVDEQGQKHQRRGFRHELASMLAWIEHAPLTPARDLIAYLIAAHHGKVRMGLRALPTENEPPDRDILYARGVWQGDRLPAVALNGKSVPETTLRLDVMWLGEGPQGPSWTERTQRLLDTYGPFRLAWLEALVRIADWRASAKETGG